MIEISEEKKSLAPSVDTAIDILTFLGKYKNRNSTLTEISVGIGTNRSTCYRILQTLVDRKIINYKNETKRFSLGTYLMVLGSRASEHIDYMAIAREYLVKIAELTQSSCGIVQRIGDEWVYIDKVIPSTPYSITIKTGQRFPLNAGSTAKLIMSYLSDEERKEVLTRIGLKKYTKNTKTEMNDFLEALPRIKEQGFAISIEEHVEGIVGMAFPVTNRIGELEFVITIVLLNSGKKEEDLTKIAHRVKALTDELTTLI